MHQARQRWLFSGNLPAMFNLKCSCSEIKFVGKKKCERKQVNSIAKKIFLGEFLPAYWIIIDFESIPESSGCFVFTIFSKSFICNIFCLILFFSFQNIFVRFICVICKTWQGSYN